MKTVHCAPVCRLPRVLLGSLLYTPHCGHWSGMCLPTMKYCDKQLLLRVVLIAFDWIVYLSVVRTDGCYHVNCVFDTTGVARSWDHQHECMPSAKHVLFQRLCPPFLPHCGFATLQPEYIVQLRSFSDSTTQEEWWTKSIKTCFADTVHTLMLAVATSSNSCSVTCTFHITTICTHYLQTNNPIKCIITTVCRSTSFSLLVNTCQINGQCGVYSRQPALCPTNRGTMRVSSAPKP